MLKLPHTKSCFVCGLNNPLGLKLDFETDGQNVRARFVPRTEHVGFRETVHGGLISTVLGEAMVWDEALLLLRRIERAFLATRPAKRGIAGHCWSRIGATNCSRPRASCAAHGVKLTRVRPENTCRLKETRWQTF